MTVAGIGGRSPLADASLPAPQVIGAGTLLGAAAGIAVPALRGSRGGALLRPGAIGAAAGAALGVSLLAADSLSGGLVGTVVDSALGGKFHRVGLVLSNLHRPWLLGEARASVRDALTAARALYEPSGLPDDEADAYRHAHAASLFMSRAMHEHGLSLEEAKALTLRAGRAYEDDNRGENIDVLSRDMDLHNNGVGVELVVADPDASAAELRDAAAAAARAGRLRLVDRFAPGGAALVASRGPD